MSFGSTFDVGTLTAQFTISSSAATASLAGIQSQMTTLRQSFTQNNILNVNTTAATAAIEKTTASARGLKTVLETIGGLAIFGALIKGADDLGKSIFGMNSQLQQSQVAFTALTGSAQTAAGLVSQLEAIAAHSTFGLNQLQLAAQQMLAFGVNAQNVPALIVAIQNAAAASGGDIQDKFQRINVVVSELAAGLPVTERQIRQLGMAGVDVQALADKLGITNEQLYNVGKTGIVTSQQIVTALSQVYGAGGQFGDFMAKQAQTFSGALQVIKTNVALAAATGFKPLFDAVSSLAIKIAEFVQTPTFNQWAAEVRSAVTAVMSVLEELGAILAPIGKAFADLFGFNTGNIAAEMEAAKNMTVQVQAYDSSLQGAGDAAGNAKEQLKGYTQQVDAANAAILGLNRELADNQVLLDANARAIAAVKNQYDPIIKSAEQSIKDINTPTADELARKTQELQLDRDRANLELTKPDTSLFDARILSDQTTLDNMPRLDTSSWDTNIANAQASLENLQDTDPAAGLKNEIQSLQGAISGLNTDEFDRKINAIKDKLAEPAPDTHGISNQLTALEAQLSGGQISQSQFDQQYGALSRQKQDINQKYQDDTTGLKGQLKILEQQRADQRLANQETAKADRARITDLNEQVKVAEAGHKKDMADLQDYIKAQEAARTKATKADELARQKLQDDIRQEGNLRAQALAPYDAAMKKITDAQAHNAALDKAAAAQRALDLAPYQAALDKAKASETEELTPLLAKKQLLDDHKTSLTEAKQQQELAKQSAEGQAKALKDGAANARGLADSLSQNVAPAIQKIIDSYDVQGDSPLVTQLKNLKTWLEEHKDDISGALKNQWDLTVKNTQEMADAITKIFHVAQDLWRGDWTKFFADIGLTQTNGQKTWLNDRDTFYADLGLKDSKYYGNFSKLVGDTFSGVSTLMQTWWTNQTTVWGNAFSDLGTMVKHAIGPDGGITNFFKDLPGHITDALAGMDNAIGAPFQTAWQTVGDFFNKIGSGVHWLASHFPGIKDIPDFSQNSIGGVPVGPPLPGHAAGIANNPVGHWAVVGEKGPEPMWVPQGSTILPNHLATAMGMLPGHADGLNFDFLGDALGAVGKFIKGSAEKAVGALMDKIGVPDLGIVPGLGTSLFDMAKNGLLSFLKPQEAASSGGRSGGGNLDIVRAVKSVTDDPDIWLAMLMAVASEQRTLSGPFVDQIGGGPGRGPFQIEAAPGGSNYGMISEDDARDPFKSAQYMVGRFIAAKRGPWGSDNETAGAETAAAAEVGAAFLAGNVLGYPQDVVDAAYQMATQALAVSSQAAGPFQRGGFPNVLADAQAHLGEMFHAGHEWNLWCEQFAELAGEDVGYPHLGWATALDHANGVTLNSGVGPAGSTMLWGDGYYPLGHAAISVGDGSVIGTSSRGISQYDMSGANDYRGWAPPGLKDGAYITTPTLAMVGEGTNHEIVAPVPMLREIVRQEAGGQTFNLYGGITITPAAGREGSDVFAAIEREAKRRGMTLNSF